MQLTGRVVPSIALMLLASPVVAQQPPQIRIELAAVELALSHAQAEAVKLAREHDQLGVALKKAQADAAVLQAWWADYLKGIAPPDLK